MNENDNGGNRRNRRGDPRPEMIAVQSKEYATGAHLHMLLGVVDLLCHNLRAPAFDTDGAPVKHEMDGGTKSAIETTVIKACSALDDIIDQTLRWSIKESCEAEKRVRDVMKANIEFLKAQKKAAEHILRPCVRLQPRLVRVSDGTYAVYLGDIEAGTALVGQGYTPEAALAAFDQVFAGKTPEEMKQWIAQKTSNDKYPTPEKENNEQERSLDTGTTGTPTTPPSSRRNAAKHRKRSGNGGVSGSKQGGSYRQWKRGQLFGPDGSPVNPS